MLSAISAESLKLRRHRATWLLVWIFPLGAVLLPLIAILAQLAQGDPPAPAAVELQEWMENAAGFWNVPPNGLIRYLTCAYIAVVFAGEYGWNTWKLIVPHRSRATLLAAKYAVALAFLLAAFLAGALITTGMTWLEDVLLGNPMPEGITAGGLVHVHWQGFASAAPAVLFTVALAALASILTRSTTAALVVGVVVVTLEQLFRTFGPMLSLHLPGVVELLYHALPGYHLGNLGNWAVDGEAWGVPFPPDTVISYGWETSLAIVAAWIVAFVALTFWRFGRQDIN
jgi:ABC-type transport system involved in multi-copper enzyme maturation permease subunit